MPICGRNLTPCCISTTPGPSSRSTAHRSGRWMSNFRKKSRRLFLRHSKRTMAKDQSQLDAVNAVRIPAGVVSLEGELGIPGGARALVIFAHGSGSSRRSERNRYVARKLREGGLATLLFDLLTSEEEAIDLRTAHMRFDIGLLAERLVAVTDWIRRQPETSKLAIGYFGASTGA